MGARDFIKTVPLAQKLYRRVVVPLRRQSEPDLYLIRGNRFDTTIDVGANVGTYAIELAKASRVVLAFEPVRSTYRILKQVVQSNVKCYQYALGAADEVGTIYIPMFEGQLTSSRATINSEGLTGGAEQRVEIRCFDTCWPTLRTNSDACIDFIKVDVEGYELSALKGMIRTVQQYLPVLLIEVEVRYNHCYAEVFTLLTMLGYKSFYTSNGVNLNECSANDLPQLQTEDRLLLNRIQKARRYGLGDERHYINNFWFVHPASRAASRLESIVNVKH